jgi:actin-related protein 8
VLVLPDNFVKHHVRYILDMLFIGMGFKAIFVHTESVMATYGMAAQSGCVVDIGSQKISVCCIDEGIILPKTMIKRNFGGDDITELLFRLIQRKDSMHFFPKHVFYPMQYPYHMMLLEQLKETYGSMQMNDQSKDLVKVIKLWLKE